MVESVQRLRISHDAPAIPHYRGIDPVLVNVAVKDLAPSSTSSKTDAIADARKICEMRYHHHVMAFAFFPAVKHQDAILIVRMHRTVKKTAIRSSEQRDRGRRRGAHGTPCSSGGVR